MAAQCLPSILRWHGFRSGHRLNTARKRPGVELTYRVRVSEECELMSSVSWTEEMCLLYDIWALLHATMLELYNEPATFRSLKQTIPAYVIHWWYYVKDQVDLWSPFEGFNQVSIGLCFIVLVGRIQVGDGNLMITSALCKYRNTSITGDFNSQTDFVFAFVASVL